MVQSCVRTTWSWCRRTLTRIPPTDTHGRAAELLRVWLPDVEDVSVETSDTVEFVDPGGNWEGVACPACGADFDTPEWGEAMSRGYRVSEGFVGPPAQGVAVATCASC